MKRFLIFTMTVAMLSSCSGKESLGTLDGSLDASLGHDEIVLGPRLENPYKTENMRDAFESLYPTRSREEIQTTDLYVRFLPESEDEYNRLLAENLELTDHPLDYSIKREGDWYHDPDIPDDAYTWQYAVVPKDFDFKNYRYQILDECVIMEYEIGSRALGVDWEAVERASYEMTGNVPQVMDTGCLSRTAHGLPVRAAASFRSGGTAPSGRISIIDPEFNGGRPFGVAGVRVVGRSFVKFARCYTDRDGYYTLPKCFSSDVRYSLVFKNVKGFSIGFNAIVVPASVSTLGKSSPAGRNVTVTRDSESKLFRRCVVNNAAYDYISRCENEEDLGLRLPPDHLRFWIFNSMSASSTMMIHHGAVVSSEHIAGFLGAYSFLVSLFAPDITIGTSGKATYRDIYKSVVHEMSHASHFSQVGKNYWNKFIGYIISSFLSGSDTYGDGTAKNAGVCEVGEMWAYYMESLLCQHRYGGDRQLYGCSHWFFPQIFRYLEDRGFSPAQLFAALQEDVEDREALEDRLCQLYEYKKRLINQAFARYSR